MNLNSDMDSNTDLPTVSLMQLYPISSNAKLISPQIIHIPHPALEAQKISYEQTITDTIHVSERVEDQIESQVIMSCQQTHLRSIQQAQILTTDMSQSLHAPHVIVPQVPLYKEVNYYGQYEMIINKDDTDDGLINESDQSAVEQLEMEPKLKEEIPAPKRKRSAVPNPSSWMVNVRKQKHQRGEAYTSRRGRYVPEKKIRNTKNCLTSCKFVCNQRISDADRELIFKAFYSLTTNEKKHFLLNTTERHKVRDPHGVRKQYNFKYFFLVRAVRYNVCKNFYLGTLAISQKPVYNVHMNKSEANLPKPDGRGLSPNSINLLPLEDKLRVRKHILSLQTVDLKPIKSNSRKRQYLNKFSSVKQMYQYYVTECNNDCVKPVRESMYRRIVKQHFNLHFKKPSQLCDNCKKPIDKKH